LFLNVRPLKRSRGILRGAAISAVGTTGILRVEIVQAGRLLVPQAGSLRHFPLRKLQGSAAGSFDFAQDDGSFRKVILHR